MLIGVAVAALGGCKYGSGASERVLRSAPAFVGGDDPLAIAPAWQPNLPDRVGTTPEEVLGVRVLAPHVLAGDPLNVLLRTNRNNLPWRQRVHLELWDETGLNIIWEGVTTVDPNEATLVQIAPLGDASLADQTLLLKVRAAAFVVFRKVQVLPRPPAAGMAFRVADPENLLASGVYPLPLPTGPVGPNTDALHLLGVPGETVCGVAVVWAHQRLEGLASTIQPAGRDEIGRDADPPPFYLGAVSSVDVLAPRADGTMPESPSPASPGRVTLEAGQWAAFVLRVAIPADTPPSRLLGYWRIDARDEMMLSRPVYLNVHAPPPGPAPDGSARDRYLAMWQNAKTGAELAGGPAAIRARAADRAISRAVDYYAGSPPTPGHALAAPYRQDLPWALRWMILRSIEQVRRAQ